MVERSLGVREAPGSIPGSPNPRPPRVVFLYAYRPSGHSSAASALRCQLAESLPAARSEELDLGSDLHPAVGPVIRKAYLEMLANAPAVWDYLYDNPAVARAVGEFQGLLSLLHRRKLRARLAALRPDAIVCTHALPCATLALERGSGRIGAPVVAVPTDFGVHAYWISPHVDLYLAPTGEAGRELVRRGVDPGRVLVTGIPVHPRFASLPEKGPARRGLGLAENRRTILVGGGTLGIGPIREIVLRLLSDLPESQILAVCGNNGRLHAQLRQLSERHAGRRLKPLPFTRSMPSCLAAADLVVGKAGGVTAAECLAAGVPMLLLSPLPGQEERNTLYLTRRGAARRARDLDAMAREARGLLRSRDALSRMRAAALRLGKPDSSSRICGAVLKLLGAARRRAT